MSVHRKTAIDGNTLEKRFLALTDRQDSINTLSQWCLQKRSHAREIIAVWLKVFQRVKPARKLTLFYLANDVIQFSTAKHIPDYLDEWKAPLLQAIPEVRGLKDVRPKVERVLKIWLERKIYSKPFMQKLFQSLSKAPAPDSSGASGEGTKPSVSKRSAQKELVARVANFKPIEFVRLMKEAEDCHRTTELAEKDLNEVESFQDPKYAVSPSEFRSRFKDRDSSEKQLREIEALLAQLDRCTVEMEKDLTIRRNVIVSCETAVKFFRVQESEAKTVASAYETYHGKVLKQKQRVEEMVDGMPEAESPVPSPREDVPSPTPEDGLELELELEMSETKRALAEASELLDEIPLPATMPTFTSSTMAHPLASFLSSVSLPPSIQELANRKRPRSPSAPPPPLPPPPPPNEAPPTWPPQPPPTTVSWDSDGMTWGADPSKAPTQPVGDVDHRSFPEAAHVDQDYRFTFNRPPPPVREESIRPPPLPLPREPLPPPMQSFEQSPPPRNIPREPLPPPMQSFEQPPAPRMQPRFVPGFQEISQPSRFQQHSPPPPPPPRGGFQGFQSAAPSRRFPQPRNFSPQPDRGLPPQFISPMERPDRPPLRSPIRGQRPRWFNQPRQDFRFRNF